MVGIIEKIPCCRGRRARNEIGIGEGLARQCSACVATHGPIDPARPADPRRRRRRPGSTGPTRAFVAGEIDSSYEFALPCTGHSGADFVLARDGSGTRCDYGETIATDYGGCEMGNAAKSRGRYLPKVFAYAIMRTFPDLLKLLSRDSSRRPNVSAKPKKITVLLEPSEFRQFDLFCKERGFKKSTLLARLIREFLDKELAGEESHRLPLFDQTSPQRRPDNDGGHQSMFNPER
jgi:hypothetical protein